MGYTDKWPFCPNPQGSRHGRSSDGGTAVAEDDLPAQQRKRRPIPGMSDTEERLLAMVTALTGQLAVTRERLDTLERLLSRAGAIDRADFESFSAEETASREREALRQSIIAKVFRPLQESAAQDLRRARAESGEPAPPPTRTP